MDGVLAFLVQTAASSCPAECAAWEKVGGGGLTFKIVLIGDGGVGKTALAKKHLTGRFATRYIPTIGVETHFLTFSTSCGPVSFDTWDTAGTEEYQGLREGYYVNARAALIMFDVTDPESYAHVVGWHRDIKRSCGQIPVTVVGNKIDRPNRKVQTDDVRFHKSHGLAYFETSVKEGQNVTEPFEWLAQQLTGSPNLRFMRDSLSE